MKKLAVVFALVVSGFVNAQTATEIEQYKKECNCDEKLAVEIHNSVNEINNWTNKTQTFKTFVEKNNIEKIDFLKVDCEGGEIFIFTEEINSELEADQIT